MNKSSIDSRKLQFIFLVVIILTALYGLSYINYLLFHTIAELFSIVIGFGLFMFAWTTRDIDENEHLVRLGIAFLFIAFLDLMHTLSYSGMQIFTDYDFYANQLWVAARLMEALTLFFYAATISVHPRISHRLIFGIYTILTAAAIYTIFVSKTFPICFIPGQGQTFFKFWAEIGIMVILVLSMIMLRRNQSLLSSKIYRWVQISILLTIFGELAFTIYVSNYGISNLIGHYLKIISFYLIYKAILETGLRSPLELLFKRLKSREKELENANQAKDTLFSIIAHDLKGPIGALTKLTELLIGELPNMDRDELVKMMKQMQKSSKQSLDLLEDLFSWAHTQTGQMELEVRCFSAPELIAEVFQTLMVTANQKEITLRSQMLTGVDTNAFGDPKMVATILRNLVSNSIKFTPRGGVIKVTVDRSIKGKLRFSVKDSGVGIEEERLQTLFKPDHHFTSPGTESEVGTGFGLLLCKELLALHEETMRVESTPGKGTTISFTLPYCEDDRQSE